jgi:protein TonB
VSVALSFAFHGLAVVPLLLAGTSGNTPADEPAFLVEVALAAPAPADPAGPAEPQAGESRIDLPEPDQPPPVDVTEIADRKVVLSPPEEPPPLAVAELKSAEPPRPQPQVHPKPKPSAPSRPPASRPTQKPAATRANPAPDAGTAQVSQTAAARASAIVWEHHPRFRTTPRPATYPPRAIELGQHGEALVHVRLQPDGSAAEILLFRSSGHALLDRAALAAVRGWQFLPAMRKGRAVAAWVEIPVRFHLR